MKAFQEDDDGPDDSIGNLVLLDAATNQSYKNAPFPVKRRRILSLDKNGTYVPLCTRNVFLKAYNPRAENTIFWSLADRDGYRRELSAVLCRFFKGA